MKSVGIKVLKNKLSEYVRLASGGETILICDRDDVVAELRPVDASRATAVADALLADAVRSGLITPALLASGRPPEADRSGTLDAVLAGLADDRDDR
jgi:antitoxin (DNA-binding transcriptional repressor) of toxin-antitoxin stability system